MSTRPVHGSHVDAWRSRALLFAAAMSLSGACSSGPAAGNGPTVVGTSPLDGADDVNPDTTVRVTFDRELDPATLLPGTISLAPEVAGSLSWDAVGRTATFRPDSSLEPGTAYTVTVAASLADEAGHTMAESVTFGFATRAADASPVACDGSDSGTLSHGGDTATVTVTDRDSDTRTYVLQTTAALRDDEPANKTISFAEEPGQMILRSGHDLCDALFAMAVEEVRQNSVSSITDGAFNGGNPVACECFETGEKWKYVWTRDTAYAVHLALGLVDPVRSKNSLLFKLSERKGSVGGGERQIVQDTGSGGSYPVSSDRVVWALCAREVLAFLDGGERTEFRDLAYEAAVNTVEQDRIMVYDPRDGLYRGEQSFLDWREQSYPSWTAEDTSHLAMSKALSTNVGHHELLRLAADLAAELGDSTAENRYRGWAQELATAIHARLWLDDVGLYSTLATTELDAAALHKYDLLGESLAVLFGIPDPAQAESVVAGYPRSQIGAPVIWPQQPLTPIYHNRGMWPFVSAYSLLAARRVENAAVFDHDLESLVRGAALNLSNMENFDFLTGANWTEDGDYSGPVVNSRRQLWSVAGYLAMVIKGVVGLEVGAGGIRFRPMITASLRRRFLGTGNRLRLANIPYQGKLIDVEILLPECAETGVGFYDIGSVRLDESEIGEDFITAASLGEHSTVSITLNAANNPAGSAVIVPDDGDFRRIWAPREPRIVQVVDNGGLLELSLDAGGESGIVFNIYRNGALVASGLSATTWTDPDSGDRDTTTYCYAVESEFESSSNRSHHSPTVCYWGPGYERITEIDADDFIVTGGVYSTQYGRPHYQGWGDPDHTLEIPGFQPTSSGDYYVQLGYGNGAGPVNTGITAAVKWVVIADAQSGAVAAEGPVTMPQRGDWSIWAESTLLPVTLDAARTYRILIRDGLNMSYFAHFSIYGGQGGGAQPYNHVNIASVKFLAL